MDPDPAIFVIDLQDANKKLFLSQVLLLKVHNNIIIQREKVIKKSLNSRNQGFYYYFCLMIEGSGAVPLTNGSGAESRRPKTYGSGSATPLLISFICNRSAFACSAITRLLDPLQLSEIWIQV